MTADAEFGAPVPEPEAVVDGPPLAVSMPIIQERLQTAVVVLTADLSGKCDLLRAGFVSIPDTVAMLRSFADHLEKEDRS